MAERHGNILVVDDEADVRTLISAALGEDGHDVVAMASGEEAVPTLSAGDYDVAFIDINLPGMSGFDLLDQHVAAGGARRSSSSPAGRPSPTRSRPRGAGPTTT